MLEQLLGNLIIGRLSHFVALGPGLKLNQIPIVFRFAERSLTFGEPFEDCLELVTKLLLPLSRRLWCFVDVLLILVRLVNDFFWFIESYFQPQVVSDSKEKSDQVDSLAI